MTSAQIIDRFGGTSALARMMGLPVSTVDSWRRWNAIPDWRKDTLLQLALSEGVQLSTSDFPEPHERKQKAAA
jgi:hypothetical protein